MSTTEVTPNLSSDVAIKSENLTYRRFAKVDAEGKVASEKTKLSSSEKTVETLAGNTEYQQAGEFTVKSYSVGSEEGFAELVPDAEERINIINRGIASKFNSKISPLLKEFDEDKNEFVYNETEVLDTRDMLAEPTSKKLSPLDKAIKGVVAAGGIDAATLRSILAAVAAGQKISIE